MSGNRPHERDRVPQDLLDYFERGYVGRTAETSHVRGLSPTRFRVTA